MSCEPYATNDLEAIERVQAAISSMVMVDVPEEAFVSAAKVRAATRLKALDALHVATALEHGCAELWTADVHLSKVASQNLTIRLVS